MLERLAAREDDDLRRAAPRRPRAAGARAPGRASRCPPVTTTRLSVSICLASSSDHLVTISPSGGSHPVAARRRELSRLRSISTDGSGTSSTSSPNASRTRVSRSNFEIGSAPTCQMPSSSGWRSIRSPISAREHGRRRAAEDRPRVAARLAADGEEPLEQPARAVELAPEHRGPQRQHALALGLAGELRAPVEVGRVGPVVLGVAAAVAGEHAVGGDVDQARAALRAGGGELRAERARWRARAPPRRRPPAAA